MTLAIGHKEGDVVVIDALRERKPPFNPDSVELPAKRVAPQQNRNL